MSTTHSVPRSAVRDIVWPAITTGTTARQLALQQQFQQSERWDPARLRAQQFIQLQQLTAHAARTMPFWRARLRDAGITPGAPLDDAAWSRIPVLTRAEAQDAGAALHCLSIPPAHGETYHASTSGSSGRPLNIAKTALHQQFWDAFQLREALWQGLDMRAKTGAIRTLRDIKAGPGGTVREADWGATFAPIFATGPAVAFEIRRPIAEQAAWMLREDPEYLLSFSANLSLLAQHFRDAKSRPKRLRKLRGFAEIVSADMRDLCRDVFGVEIIDSYSSEEVGYIALQCPAHLSALHVMAEGVFLEVLNPAGQPCAPGEIGRVVVTPLHNFAMPMLRYEIGDLAECGGPCACGRGLPVLNRIIGRSRAAVIMPDGTARAAFFGSKSFYKIPAIRQYQAAQTARDTIEIRLVVRQELTADEAAFITQVVRDDLDPSFQIRIVYTDDIPRMPSGKFEEFRCEFA